MSLAKKEQTVTTTEIGAGDIRVERKKIANGSGETYTLSRLGSTTTFYFSRSDWEFLSQIMQEFNKCA